MNDIYESPSPYSENGGSAAALRDPEFAIQELIEAAIRYVEGASSMPLSASVMINRQEMLNLLYAARDHIPPEITYAREMLRERTAFMGKVKREGEDIIDRAKDKAAHLIQKTEIMKEAERKARNIVEQAKEDAQRIRRDVDDYCDSRLGRFENILRRTHDEVLAGRKKFQADPLAEIKVEQNQQQQTIAPPETPGFFDQEQV